MKKDSNIGLSPSACEMFLLLRDWLHNINESLEEPLFREVWQKLAELMNTFVHKQVSSWIISHFAEHFADNAYGTNFV